MKILQVTPFFTPQMGGAAQVPWQISRALGKEGHQVTILTSDYGSGKSAFAEGPFHSERLPCVSSRWGFYITPRIFSWARNHVRNFDLVHMHTFRSFQNIVIRHFAVRYGVPYILSMHGTFPILFQRRLAKRIYDILVGNAILKSADRLIAVTPAEADQFQQAGINPERISMIPNGLDLEEFKHLPERGAFRRRIAGVNQNTKLILFLGRLHPIKGVDQLIESFPSLLAEFQDCRLIIAGPDEGALVKLRSRADQLGMSHRVLFPGPLFQQDRLAAYVDADVLVYPSRYEIFGLVPFEAMMCGTPVVVTRDSGAGSLIAEEKIGFLFSYGNTQDLVSAIRHVLRNKHEAESVTRRGQDIIRQRMSWEKIVKELAAVYAGILRRSP